MSKNLEKQLGKLEKIITELSKYTDTKHNIVKEINNMLLKLNVNCDKDCLNEDFHPYIKTTCNYCENGEIYYPDNKYDKTCWIEDLIINKLEIDIDKVKLNHRYAGYPDENDKLIWEYCNWKIKTDECKTYLDVNVYGMEKTFKFNKSNKDHYNYQNNCQEDEETERNLIKFINDKGRYEELISNIKSLEESLEYNKRELNKYK